MPFRPFRQLLRAQQEHGLDEAGFGDGHLTLKNKPHAAPENVAATQKCPPTACKPMGTLSDMTLALRLSDAGLPEFVAKPARPEEWRDEEPSLTAPLAHVGEVGRNQKLQGDTLLSTCMTIITPPPCFAHPVVNFRKDSLAGCVRRTMLRPPTMQPMEEKWLNLRHSARKRRTTRRLSPTSPSCCLNNGHRTKVMLWPNDGPRPGTGSRMSPSNTA